MDSRLTFIIISAVFLFSPFCMAKAGSWTEMGTGTRMPLEKWCYRQQKYSVVRYHNITAEPEIQVDVGECRARDNLSPNQAITKPSNDCVPSSLVMKRVLLYHTFIAEMERVLTCQKVPSTCQRLPRMVTYYPGTMYRRTIDVGACEGLCRDKMACKATRVTTFAPSTPNGKRSIEVIQDCSCVIPYCYRVSAFEAFPEQYTDAKGENAVRTKLIDMGKCVDNNRCPIQEKRHWPFTFPKVFHIHREIRCSKNTTKVQSYVAIGGRQVNVATINTCSCN